MKKLFSGFFCSAIANLKYFFVAQTTDNRWTTLFLAQGTLPPDWPTTCRETLNTTCYM